MRKLTEIQFLNLSLFCAAVVGIGASVAVAFQPDGVMIGVAFGLTQAVVAGMALIAFVHCRREGI